MKQHVPPRDVRASRNRVPDSLLGRRCATPSTYLLRTSARDLARLLREEVRAGVVAGRLRPEVEGWGSAAAAGADSFCSGTRSVACADVDGVDALDLAAGRTLRCNL